jgi:hypothetical protein
MKCDDLFEAIINLKDDRGNYNLFDLAQCFLRGYNIEKLRWLLKSDDISNILNGIYISIEVASLKGEFSSELMELVDHPDQEVRTQAEDAVKRLGLS